MILNSETFQKFGYLPKNVGEFSKNILLVKCDICNINFEKTACQINTCRKNSKSEIDVCKNIDCVKQKRTNTMLKKFGVKNAGQSRSIREVVENTCLRKFGVKNPFQSKEIKKKIKETNISLYGCENPFQSKKIKEKIKQNIVNKFGVEYNSQRSDVKEKTKNTFNFKWGGIGTASKDIMEKIKNTTLKNNGGFGFSSRIVSDKIKKTNIKRYGTEFPSSSTEIKHKVMTTHAQNYGCHYFKTPEFKEIRKETNIKKYGQENPILSFSRRSRGRISKFQKEIYSCILTIDNDAIMEKEITKNITSDIYLPSKNLIVECYGDYWHCNPEKYVGEFINKNLNQSAAEKWTQDVKRIEDIKALGFSVMIIWEGEWKKFGKNILNNL